MTAIPPKRITTPEARYLKHEAMNLADQKVSIRILGARALIHIGDFEFETFHDARHYIKIIASTIVAPDETELDEVAS